ncbi:MAG: OmpA family protein [Proteobacteria bacterium]|nr:OmpA family protein [Pseudomonadota bacterium]
MRKYAFAAVAVAALLLLPNFAQAYPKQGWYLGTAAGLNIEQDTDVKSGGITNRLFFDPGFAVSGSLGYGFESQFRPELEVTYRRNTLDIPHGPGASSAHGNFNSVAFMGNLLYDFNTNSGFTPYLGVGVGGALIDAQKAGIVFGGNTIDEQDFQFAYQGIAGASFELSEHVDLTADYHFFRTLDPRLKTAAGARVTDTEYMNHSIMLGLRFIFGVDRPEPAPVVMREAPRAVVVIPAPVPMAPVMRPVVQAPPPPPPPVPETYIVFFDFDKYYLTAEAKETLQHAADAYHSGGVARVQVTGHTDTSGSYRYNRRLSDRRARVVKQYMVALGIPENEIDTRGAGESELMVMTGDNVREAKNRRAEIIMRE